MPSTVTPDPTTALTPAAAPDDGVYPVLEMPVDLEDLDADSIAQAAPAVANSVAWLMDANPRHIRGISRSFDGGSNPSTWNNLLTNAGTAKPFSCWDVMPTFAPASGYDVDIGAGSGFLYYEPGTPANLSPFHQIIAPADTLTFATPDASNRRTDLVVVDAAGAFSVVTGTPGSTFPPPAIPAGSAVVFYVAIPLLADAADASAFRVCRGTWRRAAYPFTGMTGVLGGCDLYWDLAADPTAASADISMGAPDVLNSKHGSLHRVLIDGEMVEWFGFLSSSGGGRTADSAHNPFGSSAPAGYDRPYYIYLAGGRHNPMPTLSVDGSDVFLNPAILVESTVAPNVYTGKPTANMTVNGATVTPDGAVYVGLGWVVANTTRRRACIVDGDMTTTMVPIDILSHSAAGASSESVGDFNGRGMPAVSTVMRLNIAYFNAQGTAKRCTFRLKDFVTDKTSVVTPIGTAVISAEPSGYGYANGVKVATNRVNGSELFADCGGAADIVVVMAHGFNHRVSRLCG